MFPFLTALNDKLSGCSFEQEGNDFYIVGADSVRKKLDKGNGELSIIEQTTSGTNNYQTPFTRPNSVNEVYVLIFGATTISNLSAINGDLITIKLKGSIAFCRIENLTGDFSVKYTINGTGSNTIYILYSE